MLSAWGEGTVKEGAFHTHLSTIYRKFKKEYAREPRDVSLLIEDTFACGYGYGFTEIDTAFLEQINTLAELVLPNSITNIDMTPTLEQILKRNNVLIRGSFDSFAEKFAAENHLHFRPADFLFARGGDLFNVHLLVLSIGIVVLVVSFGNIVGSDEKAAAAWNKHEEGLADYFAEAVRLSRLTTTMHSLRQI